MVYFCYQILITISSLNRVSQNSFEKQNIIRMLLSEIIKAVVLLIYVTTHDVDIEVPFHYRLTQYATYHTTWN